MQSKVILFLLAPFILIEFNKTNTSFLIFFSLAKNIL